MKVLPPVSDIHGCVSFDPRGAVWATYVMPGLSTAYQRNTDRLDVHRRVVSALMAVAGECGEMAILSVAVPVDPASITDTMLAGVDPTKAPNWGPTVKLAAAVDAQRQTYRHTVFLSVKLAEPSGAALAAAAWRVAENRLGVELGVPVAAATRAEKRRRTDEAQAMATRLTHVLGDAVLPVSASIVAWLYERSMQRGIDVLPPTEHLDSYNRGQLLAVADRTQVFEGRWPDDPNPEPKGIFHRYATVVTELEDGGHTVGYQAVAVMSGMPKKWRHPGRTGEWLARVNELGLLADVCTRLKVQSTETVLGHLRRKRANAIGTIGQMDSESTPPPAEQLEQLGDLDDLRDVLSNNPSERSLQATTMVALSGPPSVLDANMKRIGDAFAKDGFRWDRALGHQCAMLACFQPGSAPHGALDHYGQYLLCDDFASALPFEATAVGDTSGPVVADLLSGGPVFLDLERGPRENRSSTYCFIGDMGGGKTFSVMSLMYFNLARGGRGVSLDKTIMGEYARYARYIPSLLPGVSARVVELSDRTVCLDPMQIFRRPGDAGEDLRRKYTLGLSVQMLRMETMSIEYRVFARAVDANLRSANPSMNGVRSLLHQMRESENTEDLRAAAATVAAKLDTLSEDPFGQSIFGDGEPLDMWGTDYLVFAAPNLVLPSQEQMKEAHLYRELPPEQIIGKGLIYLVTAITREVAFETSRFCLCTFDEAKALLDSPEGLVLLNTSLTDSRKHRLAIAVLSQDGIDVEAVKARFSVWFTYLMVHPDNARRALRCMGMAETAEMVDMLTDPDTMGNGVALGRFLDREIGLVHWRGALTQEQADAQETNPEKVAIIDARRPPVITPPRRAPRQINPPAADMDGADDLADWLAAIASPVPSNGSRLC